MGDSRRLQVSVLTGFLGAGKSRLLRRLLAASEMQGTAVIVNEIDQAGTEAIALTQAYLELTASCVCCVTQPELLQALERFAHEPKISRLVIETTGLADPLALRFSLGSEAIGKIATLDAILAVLDPLHFDPSLEEWRAQVQGADILILGKEDLASVAKTQACKSAAQAINPRARTVTASQVTPALLFSMNATFELNPPSAAHAEHSEFRSLPMRFSGVLPLAALEDRLCALPTVVFRGKGWVRTDAGWIRFQLVGGRLEVELDAPPPPHAESRAIFFGRSIAAEHLASIRGLSR